jgi:hypothetical protein
LRHDGSSKKILVSSLPPVREILIYGGTGQKLCHQGLIGCRLPDNQIFTKIYPCNNPWWHNLWPVRGTSTPMQRQGAGAILSGDDCYTPIRQILHSFTPGLVINTIRTPLYSCGADACGYKVVLGIGLCMAHILPCPLPKSSCKNSHLSSVRAQQKAHPLSPSSRMPQPMLISCPLPHLPESYHCTLVTGRGECGVEYY